MNRDTFKAIVDFMTPYMNIGSRRAIVEKALFGSPVLQRIDWTGDNATFTARLVSDLQKYGDLEPGVPALVAVLIELRGQVGVNHQRKIDTLIAAIASDDSPESAGATEVITIHREFAMTGLTQPLAVYLDGVLVTNLNVNDRQTLHQPTGPHQIYVQHVIGSSATSPVLEFTLNHGDPVTLVCGLRGKGIASVETYIERKP